MALFNSYIWGSKIEGVVVKSCFMAAPCFLQTTNSKEYLVDRHVRINISKNA